MSSIETVVTTKTWKQYVYPKECNYFICLNKNCHEKFPTLEDRVTHEIVCKNENYKPTETDDYPQDYSKICMYCDHTFPNVEGRVMHQSLHEVTSDSKKCNYCNDIFATHEDRELHETRVHGMAAA